LELLAAILTMGIVAAIVGILYHFGGQQVLV
jgi:hypothetical protein